MDKIKDNSLTDTQVPDSLLSKKSYTRTATESITSQTSSNNGTATQTTVLEREQATVKSLGTNNGSTLTPVKSTTKHLTIPELLGGVKSYDYLPLGWKNVEVIANVPYTKGIAIGIKAPMQIYNLFLDKL